MQLLKDVCDAAMTMAMMAKNEVQLQKDEMMRRDAIRKRRNKCSESLLLEMGVSGCTHSTLVVAYMVEFQTYAQLLAKLKECKCIHIDLAIKHLGHLE